MLARTASVLLFISALFLAACSVSDTKMERWAEKFTQPAIEVTATQLYREFKQDDEMAEARYSGRRVRVDGQVSEVRDDDDFEPVVEFNVGQDQWSFDGLVAQFAEGHRSKVTSWRTGTSIAVVCYIPEDEIRDLDFDSVVPLRMCQPL